jgi:hypothetical protein
MTTPAWLWAVIDVSSRMSVTRVTFHDQPYVTHGAISADRRLLALVRGESPWRGGTISIHELPEGSAGDRVRHGSVKIDAPVIGASPDKVFLAFAGNTLIAASVGRRADGEDALLLRYADDGQPEQLTGLRAALGASMIYGLAACSAPAGGFAVLCDGWVALCAGDGRLTQRIPLSVSPMVPPKIGSSLLDTEPGGQVAVAGVLGHSVDGGWAVHDPDTGRVVASAPMLGRPTGICFYGRDRLITTSEHGSGNYVHLWRLDSARSRLLAKARFPSAPNTCSPIVIPGFDRIGVRIGHLCVFDPATLKKAPVPPGLGGPGDNLWTQWNSADKRACGFGGPGYASVFPGGHQDGAGGPWASEITAASTRLQALPAD